MTKKLYTFALILFLFSSLTLVGCTEQKSSATLHMKPDYASYFTDYQVECADSIVNAFDSAFKKAYESNDPRALSEAYEVWKLNHDAFDKLDVKDPDEVTAIKWDINVSLASILSLSKVIESSYLPSTIASNGHATLSDIVYEAIVSSDLTRSFGDKELTRDNAIDQFFDTASYMHNNVVSNYE